ncbi:PREDICTED: uncharacterized protein LOC108560573, partial [Nicrophorus vespilloides]|uniref:Uncharacterized protein LOC108560573 n=1 Tax=Nicrophorus vespilloides TaxID=110193 RepID=A0ABM1MGH7_NICVS
MASNLNSPFDLEIWGQAVDLALNDINERFLNHHSIKLKKIQARGCAARCSRRRRAAGGCRASRRRHKRIKNVNTFTSAVYPRFSRYTRRAAMKRILKCILSLVLWFVIATEATPQYYNVGVLMSSMFNSSFDLKGVGPAVDLSLSDINERFLDHHGIKLKKVQA